jgi:hypothetical protein
MAWTVRDEDKMQYLGLCVFNMSYRLRIDTAFHTHPISILKGSVGDTGQRFQKVTKLEA